MSAARTERLLNLLTLLLNSRRPVSLRDIRELDEFGAYRTDDPKSGERAFERDKAALLELGVPLRWVAPEHEDDDDGLGGYVIDRERYYLPDLHLDPGELALLSIAGAAAAALDEFSGKAAVIRALAKLGFDVEEAGRAPTLAHAPLMAGIDAGRVGAILTSLHDAVARRVRVQLAYRGFTDVTERLVDPYGLYYRQGVWYLVGYCHMRQAERTFHLGRTDRVRLQGGGGAFTVPDSFDLRGHLERRPWEYPYEPVCRVSIRLADRLIPAIPEIFGRHVSREDTPRGAVIHLDVTYKAAIINAVLPYGAAAEVLSPQSLREEIGAIYTTLANRYGALSDEDAVHAAPAPERSRSVSELGGAPA